ncbi:MAG: DUF1700 domain-containing protein [Oscillospiraceae bacterium]|jgi:uncharacterized membrane protein|nr:DUF1700 domain-containing protein [Oscillospiraceae bacterium]
MNKEQFLKELEYHLRHLPQTEREDALRYYDEYISDAESEPAAIAGLGTPGNVAAHIIAAWAEPVSDKQDDEHKSKKQDNGKSQQNGFRVFWIVLLAVFASPIALPIALALAAVAIALFAVLFAVVISIAAAALGVIAAGPISLIVGFAFIFTSFSTFMLYFGLGLVCVGIGLVLIKLTHLLAKYGIGGLVKMLSNAINRRSRK